MPETTITHIRYRTVYDSRGVETLEVDVITEKGFGRVAAPFGATGSRGEFEAPAYAPGGLRESMAILEKTLIPSLIGMDAAEQVKNRQHAATGRWYAEFRKNRRQYGGHPVDRGWNSGGRFPEDPHVQIVS